MNTKDTFFSPKQTIRCQGSILDFSVPKVMGILNITPDSFFDLSRSTDEKSVLTNAARMLNEGADILDVGAYSSRPGAADIPADEEKNRLTMALRVLRHEFPGSCISVDTFRSEIAYYVTREFGVSIINDISAGRADEQMYPVVASLRIPYIMMHMQGSPQTMQNNPEYSDLINELIVFFAERIALAREYGITDIIIDPGFGFGKTVSHNYELLREFNLFRILEVPVMAGVSRKGMIYRTLGITPAEAMNGTTVLNTLALNNGACMLRVHDVKEAVEAISLFSIYRNAGKIM